VRRLIVALVVLAALAQPVASAARADASDAGWRPTLTLRVQWEKTETGGRRLVAAGTTSYAGSGRIHLQMRSGGDWRGLGYLDLSSGRFRGTPPKGAPGQGTKIRATLGSTGRRLPVFAVAVVPAPQPYRVRLNDPDGVLIEGPQPLVTVLIAASAGERISLGGEWQTRVTVLAPDGSVVLDDSWRTDFVAETDGTYRVRLPAFQSGAKRFYASTPKQVEAPLGTLVDPVADLPGQRVDVVFTGDAGQPFTDLNGQTAHDLVGAGGAPLAPWLTPHWMSGPTIYRLGADGRATVRVTDPYPKPIRLRPVPEYATSLDAGPTAVDLPDSESVAIVSVDIPQGQPFTLHSDEFFRGFGWFYEPDGTDIRYPLDARHRNPAAGVHHLVVGDGPGTKSVEFTRPIVLHTTLDGPPVAVSTEGYTWQWLWQTFTAEEGDVVKPEAVPDLYHQDVSELTALIGPDGQEIAPEGGGWRIPASGDYRFEWNLFGGWTGELSVARVPAPVG
jgi:hypothetical protein